MFDLDVAAGVLVVSGDVEVRHVEDLTRLLGVLVAGPGQVDLSAVTYLPSAAVSALVLARQRADLVGEPLVLVARPGSVAERVLTVMGVDTVPEPPAGPPSPAVPL